MNRSEIPGGMISVDEFSKLHNITKEKVISMIENGRYLGMVVDGGWFVDAATSPDSNVISSTKGDKNYHSSYEMASIVSIFVSLVGVVVFLAGVILSFSGISENASLIETLARVGIAIAGLLLVSAGQVARATIDNADNTREMLNIIRKKL